METTIVYWWQYRENGKEHGNYCSTLGGNIGATEKKMKSTIAYWG